MNDIRERALKMLAICMGADLLRSALDTLLEILQAVRESDLTAEQACDEIARVVARMLMVNHSAWYDGIHTIDPELVIPGGREPWNEEHYAPAPDWTYRGQLESALLNEIWGKEA